MRIRVSDVLDLLAAGLSAEQVVAELPDLELADVVACLRYASARSSGRRRWRDSLIVVRIEQVIVGILI